MEHPHPRVRPDAHQHHAYGPSATASVVLDIGGEIGALILHADAAHLGREVEISPVGHGAETVRTHSMVRERHTDPPSYDAVYPDLREGEYVVWREPGTAAGTVTVAGGRISTFTFR
jgi:hypothetical protein